MANIISKCKAISKLNKSKAITLIQSHKSFIIWQENNCQRIFLRQKYRRNWCMNELQFTKYSLIWRFFIFLLHYGFRRAIKIYSDNSFSRMNLEEQHFITPVMILSAYYMQFIISIDSL